MSSTTTKSPTVGSPATEGSDGSNVRRLGARLRAGRMGCPKCKQPIQSDYCPRDGFPAIPFGRLDLTDLHQGGLLGGRYLLLYRIGRGAMADVYAGWDSGAQSEVAVKLVRDELTHDPAIRARFKREAAAISRLKHPHIVKLLNAGISQDGQAYLILERLVGRTLEDCIRAEAPVEPGRAAVILAQLCDSLVALHELGILHRDLKPANVFLALSSTGKEVVKLLDFGIARRLRHDPIDDQLANGKVLGSVHYAAPEIARRGTLDEKTDLYAVGILLYELLAGDPPFDRPDDDSTGPVAVAAHAHSALTILRRHVEDDVPPLPDWIDERYRDLTRELLAKNPAFRPKDAVEVGQRLRTLANHLPAPPSAASPVRPVDGAPAPIPTTGSGRSSTAYGSAGASGRADVIRPGSTRPRSIHEAPPAAAEPVASDIENLELEELELPPRSAPALGASPIAEAALPGPLSAAPGARGAGEGGIDVASIRREIRKSQRPFQRGIRSPRRPEPRAERLKRIALWVGIGLIGLAGVAVSML